MKSSVSALQSWG